jgi:hypothetical protein
MHKAVEETERLRSRYLPKETRVLFVGESPPSRGTFFYAANRNLYFATREAFFAAIPHLVGRDFLEEFPRLGCYLDDLCLEPVNDLDANDPLRTAPAPRDRSESPNMFESGGRRRSSSS